MTASRAEGIEKKRNGEGVGGGAVRMRVFHMVHLGSMSSSVTAGEYR